MNKNSFILKLKTINLVIFAFVYVKMFCANGAEIKNVEHWTLKQMISRALEVSSEIKALNQEIIRAENLARQAGKWEAPEAAVSYGPMTQAGISGTGLDVTLRQTVPIFGQKKIAEIIARQNKFTMGIGINSHTLFLKHEVLRLAYHLAALNEEAKHISHRREKISQIVKYLENRPFAAPSQAVEKILILNRLREIEAQFLAIYSMKEKIWQSLNIFLALEEPIIPEIKWDHFGQTLDHDKWWQLCQNENPELKIQESIIATSNLEIASAEKKSLPDIRIGAGYNEQTADLPQRVYAGTIEFSLPVLGNSLKQAAVAQNEAENYRLEHKKKELKAQFEQAWISLTQSKELIGLYPISLVAKLEEHMGNAEKSWKKGLVPTTAFLELENQVHEQAIKVYETQRSYVDSLSQVLFLAGSDFNREEK